MSSSLLQGNIYCGYIVVLDVGIMHKARNTNDCDLGQKREREMNDPNRHSKQHRNISNDDTLPSKWSRGELNVCSVYFTFEQQDEAITWRQNVPTFFIASNKYLQSKEYTASPLLLNVSGVFLRPLIMSPASCPI